MTREEAIKTLRELWRETNDSWYEEVYKVAIEALSSEAEPKWNCTANFVAEQLDRLRNMTDEERCDFFIRFVSPSAELNLQTPQTYGKSINPSNAEAVEDLISRADAIVAIDDVLERTESNVHIRGVKKARLKDAIKALPAEAVQGWIPCSDRLPSEDGSYLVTSSFGKVYTAHFYSEHGRWQSNRRGLIEAWQPLPKPYREDDEA